MKTLRTAYDLAVQATKELIPNEVYSFKQRINDGDLKQYQITPEEFTNALENKYKNFDQFINKFSGHLLGQRSLIAAFASTPASFSDAWNMQSESLEAEDVLVLSKSGGHFQFNQLPYGMDKSGSTLYQNNYPKGLVQSKGAGIIKGFRHKTGGVYEEDNLNEMGVFRYATPNIPAGMIEYRFSEQFSRELKIPLIYLITQWFRYEVQYEELNKWIYMTGVAKVISNSNHPHSPIELQLISKDDAIKIIDKLLEAIQTKGEYRLRPPMPEYLRLGWSYTKIKSDPSKRQALVDYATRHKLRCPGNRCGGRFFSDLKKNEIHIGHRISQNWGVQNSGIADVHHPYNLYLSCASCNTGLGRNYPDEFEAKINELGTIGDWIISGLET